MIGKREQETGSDYAGNSVMAASGDEIADDDYEALAYQQVIISLTDNFFMVKKYLNIYVCIYSSV